jgi:hypothetical protein
LLTLDPLLFSFTDFLADPVEFCEDVLAFLARDQLLSPLKELILLKSLFLELVEVLILHLEPESVALKEVSGALLLCELGLLFLL